MHNGVQMIDVHFPVLTGKETPEQQIRLIYDYLFELQQSLQYTLRNLGLKNFNPEEMKKMALSGGGRDTAASQTGDDGNTAIGMPGKRLDLIGHIYINGVPWTEGGTE